MMWKIDAAVRAAAGRGRQPKTTTVAAAMAHSIVPPHVDTTHRRRMPSSESTTTIRPECTSTPLIGVPLAAPVVGVSGWEWAAAATATTISETSTTTTTTIRRSSSSPGPATYCFGGSATGTNRLRPSCHRRRVVTRWTNGGPNDLAGRGDHRLFSPPPTDEYWCRPTVLQRRVNSTGTGASGNHNSSNSNNNSNNNGRNNGIINRNRRKKKPGEVEPTFGTIREAQTAMKRLLRRIEDHDQPPSTYVIPRGADAQDGAPAVVADGDGAATIHRDLIESIRDYTSQLRRSLADATQHRSTKFGTRKELSKLAECILYAYGRTASPPSSSPSAPQSSSATRDCRDVLRMLELEWNLEVQNEHYELAILAATTEEDWAGAAGLFEMQIDPRLGSQTPIPIAIDDPKGLYAIARNGMAAAVGAEKTAATTTPNDDVAAPPVVEHIMDAVQRLIVVSQWDQTTYVLAAGTALGQAGLWEPAVEYLRSSYAAKQFGTSLVAAVMHACLLCGRNDEAWKVFESHVLVGAGKAAAGPSMSGLGRVWPWGGQQRDRLDPLCRDLAMRAMPSATMMLHPEEDSEGQQSQPLRRSNAALAMTFFEQAREEGVTISHEAVAGVVRACEHDGDWQNAVSVLRVALEEELNVSMSPWIVPGSQLVIEQRTSSSAEKEAGRRSALPELGRLLPSVMRNCNASSNFGVALFCIRLFQLQLPFSNTKLDNLNAETDSDQRFILEPIQSVLTHTKEATADEIMIASIVALCGLRCYQSAIDVYDAERAHGSITVGGGIGEMVYNHALSDQSRHGTVLVGNPWTSAQRHMHKLTAAWIHIKQRGLERHLSLDERELLEEGLSNVMNCCTVAHQAALSLLLMKWMDETVFKARRSPDSSIAGAFGDSLTCEVILARRWAKDQDGAVEMFESAMNSIPDDQHKRWRKTIAAGLTVLIANGRGKDALRIFQAIDEPARSPACFTAIGRHLFNENQWKELLSLYRRALEQGYSSEELGFMAMNAAVSTNVDNRLRILRAIVEECATSVGLDSETWVASRYWQIKKELGFYHARLLSWWNDPDRAPLDELNLAIKEFKNAKSNGLRPKNAVVRTLVDGAGLLDSMSLENVAGYNVVPRTVDGWTVLIDEVLESTSASPIRYDPNFVHNVVLAYKSLGCTRECVAYIKDVIHVDGTRINKSTLSEALQAAEIEDAMELQNDIQMMIWSKSRSQ